MVDQMTPYELVGPRPTLPPRSGLVRLKPHGLGTPYRESLSSYYQRLADVHSLTPQVLARELVFADITEAAPHKTYHFEDSWRLPSFNGLAVLDGKWVGRLEDLTTQEGLCELTMGFLGQFVSTRGLMTKRSKWCPACLEEGTASSAPYAQLLWSFKAVTCCPKHKVNLVSSCGCTKAEWKPSGRVKCLPHVCPRCAGNLGRLDHPKATVPSPKKLLHACMVADLLVSALATQPTTQKKTLSDFLKGTVRTLLEGNSTKLASILGVTKSSLSGWMSGKHRPEFARILQIAELHGCSLEDVLCGRSEKARLTTLLQKDQSAGKPSRRNRGAIKWKQVVAALKSELTDNTPLALTEVATRVGVDPDTLRNREPELCSAISERWHSWRKSWNSQRNIAYAEQVRMDAMRLANQGHRPSWQRLLKDGLPVVPIWQWRTFVQRTCNEVWDQVETNTVTNST